MINNPQPDWQQLRWCASSDTVLPEKVADWLLESGSMTRRLGLHCKHVRVEPTFEGFIDKAQLGAEGSELMVDRRYWVREIVLYGDDSPWLSARTILPEQTLSGPEQRLLSLGRVPLGHYLFSQPNLTRDYIQVARQGDLWARRSCLRLSGKPLLLTELFLPSSPLY